jgi:hypothetical protein
LSSVSNALAEHGLPAKVTVIYTEQTYTSAAAFFDERVKGARASRATSPSGAAWRCRGRRRGKAARRLHAQQISKGMPAFGEYTYTAGNVVLRVSKELAPSDAERYGEALEEIIGCARIQFRRFWRRDT